MVADWIFCSSPPSAGKFLGTSISASAWIEWALSDGDLEAREPTPFKIVKLEL